MNLQAIGTALPAALTTNTPNSNARPAATADTSTSAATSSTPPTTTSEAKATTDTAQLQKAIQATNDFVKPINSTVEFSMDKDVGEIVVKVVDTKTKEVIRQIPSEEMLAIAQTLDKIQGLLIKQKA